MSNIVERLTTFVQRVFKTSLEIFLEALKLSPNAQGYVLGSVTELLLKQKLESEGFEVKRIQEKWEGKKHPNHHGDLYIRANRSEYWFVLESKGVKSNSEKWNKLYNYDVLKKFLINHSDKIYFIDINKEVEPQIEAWIEQHLPRFKKEYSENLYQYKDVLDYLENLPKRETPKSRAITKLENLTRDEINNLINERLKYLMSKIKVLETHFVSGTSETSERTQATPRKDEFNLLSVDMVLRYHEHKFLFANPKLLESSGADSNHLQQNYIIGFVFVDDEGNNLLSITEEWHEDFTDAFNTLNPRNAVRVNDMQIDNRNVITKEEIDGDI
jgi:hypothetical protein